MNQTMTAFFIGVVIGMAWALIKHYFFEEDDK